MAYIVMRKDYSSTLSDENGPMTFKYKTDEEKTAKNFSGVVVNLESKLIMEEPNGKIVRIQTVAQNIGIDNG